MGSSLIALLAEMIGSEGFFAVKPRLVGVVWAGLFAGAPAPTETTHMLKL